MIDQIEANGALALAVVALASYRLTRLIVLDEIFGSYGPVDDEGVPIPGTRGSGLRGVVDVVLYNEKGDARNWFTDWFGRMITCTFCAGVWVSAAVLVGWELGPQWLQWFIVGAAVAGVAAYLNSRPGA